MPYIISSINMISSNRWLSNPSFWPISWICWCQVLELGDYCWDLYTLWLHSALSFMIWRDCKYSAFFFRCSLIFVYDIKLLKLFFSFFFMLVLLACFFLILSVVFWDDLMIFCKSLSLFPFATFSFTFPSCTLCSVNKNNCKL